MFLTPPNYAFFGEWSIMKTKKTEKLKSLFMAPLRIYIFNWLIIHFSKGWKGEGQHNEQL